MKKIDELVAKLNNKVTPSIAKKIAGFRELNEKYNLAKQEYAEEPTPENEEDLNQIVDYIDDVREDIIEDLEELIDERQADPIPEPTPITPTPEPKKEESSGMLGLVIGGILLVGSLGAINYFRNNK